MVYVMYGQRALVVGVEALEEVLRREIRKRNPGVKANKPAKEGRCPKKTQERMMGALPMKGRVSLLVWCLCLLVCGVAFFFSSSGYYALHGVLGSKLPLLFIGSSNLAEEMTDLNLFYFALCHLSGVLLLRRALKLQPRTGPLTFILFNAGMAVLAILYLSLEWRYGEAPMLLVFAPILCATTIVVNRWIRCAPLGNERRTNSVHRIVVASTVLPVFGGWGFVAQLPCLIALLTLRNRGQENP